MGRLSGVLTVINIVLYLFLLFFGNGSRTAFAMLAVEFVVGFDDTLDEFMADNVLFLEFDFADSLYAFQDLHGLYETGGRCRRQVDLCHVSGNDHFCIHSEAGEEHLDLVGRRVLRFVEDDDRIVQRPPAHESEWGDLDHVVLHVFLQFGPGNHVLQGVIQRLEVRVEFVLHLAGEES